MSAATQPTEPQRRTFETLKAQLTRSYIFARRRGLRVGPTPPFSDQPLPPLTPHPFSSHPFYTSRPLLTRRLKNPGPRSWLPKSIHKQYRDMMLARDGLFRLITGGYGADNTTPAVASKFPELQLDVLVELAARIASHEVRLGSINWHCLTFEEKRFFWEEVDRAGREMWKEMVAACVKDKEDSVDRAVETFVANERVVKERVRRERERLAEKEKKMEEEFAERERQLDERERELNRMEKNVKSMQWTVLDREHKVKERELLVTKRAGGIEFMSRLPGPMSTPVSQLGGGFFTPQERALRIKAMRDRTELLVGLGDKLLPPIGHERALRLQAEKDGKGKEVQEASNEGSS